MSAKLTVCGSSSHGNSYILDTGDEILLIEAGVDKSIILQALNYDLTRVTACIATHYHSDHLKRQTLKWLRQSGIPVYSSVSVAEKYPKVKVLEPMKKYRIGSFTILPLSVPHGDCPNLAYHITLPNGETCLFCTDCEGFPYTLKNINHIFIEANWSEDVIINKFANNEQSNSSYNTHLSLNRCIDVLKRLYSSALSTVVLLHLSDNNSDENAFKKAIFEQCGIRCEIAEKGKVFELSSDSF